MKFACLTLSFNQGDYLSEAINSILAQDEHIDYLVYDAGSNDESREIIHLYESKGLKPYLVDGDLGPADGLNRGLDLIDGDIFYYLNADDRVLPGTFKFVSDYFAAHPECDILHGSINLINQSGTIYRTLPAMKFSLRALSMGYSVVYQPATFIRKSIIPKNAFNVANRVSWDGELIVDLALAGASIHQTQTVLADFRIYPTSITGSGRLSRVAEQELARITRKILGRDPYVREIVAAFLIRKLRAARRRALPQLSNL